MSKLAVCLLLTTAATAQTVVLPSAIATNPPLGQSYFSFNVFYSTTQTGVPHDSRSQMIYAHSDISVPATIWNSISFRRPAGIGNVNGACAGNAVLVLSVSTAAHNAATTSFATNHGPNPTTVLSGPFSLPQRTDSPWPAPWENLPFTTPYTFIRPAGQSLVVDLLQTNNSGNNSWIVEAMLVNVGARFENGGYQQNCKFSTGNANGGLGYNPPYTGSTWRLSYSGGMPANLLGVGAIGSNGAGMMWGGLLLPISLAVLGAPGCSWSVSPDFTVPITSTTTSYSWPPIPIPNDPTLTGQNFYDHAFFVDPGANALGAATTWSSRWLIGNGVGAPATLVNATGAAATGATGNLTQQAGVSIQLNP